MANIIDLFRANDMSSFIQYVKSLRDVNQVVISDDSNGTHLSLLHLIAAYPEDIEYADRCLRYLLSKADINVDLMGKVDGVQGITAPMMAMIWKNERTLTTLVEHNCDLFLCDSNGVTVFEYYSSQTCVDIINKAIDKLFSDSKLDFTSYNRVLLNKSNVKHEPNPHTQSIIANASLLSLNRFLTNSNEVLSDTEIYFNDSDSYNSLNNTLVSNVSYEKTNSITSNSDVKDIFLYNDKDNSIKLIEERYEGNESDISNNIQDLVSIGSATSHSMEDTIIKMSETAIADQLRSFGDSPGPITNTTKKVYASRLRKLREGGIVTKSEKYCKELNRISIGTFPFDEAKRLEDQIIRHFDTNKTKPAINNFFNYLLLDPRITNNLSLQANCLSIEEIDSKLFPKFIESIFYVGKGNGKRAYQHFYEAVKRDKSEESAKICRIKQIWAQDKGVVSHHCFHSISSDEALFREYVIIDTLNIENLTNQVKGRTVNPLKWNTHKRRVFGSYILHKSFHSLLKDGERQIRQF